MIRVLDASAAIVVIYDATVALDLIDRLTADRAPMNAPHSIDSRS